MSLKSKFNKINKEHLGWYLYDFGNSAYAAVILLAVYSAYFKGTVVGGAEGSRYWGISVGIAMLITAIIAPILGAIADFSASKKRFLLIFSAITWVFTGLLFFVEKGDVLIGMLFFIIAEIGYRSGQVFYNSLLPEITEPEERGRVSGNGWAIGSLGGILCLLIRAAGCQVVLGFYLPLLCCSSHSSFPVDKRASCCQRTSRRKNIFIIRFVAISRDCKITW
jgi:UMF1 family MFS transporter